MKKAGCKRTALSRRHSPREGPMANNSHGTWYVSFEVPSTQLANGQLIGFESDLSMDRTLDYSTKHLKHLLLNLLLHNLLLLSGLSLLIFDNERPLSTGVTQFTSFLQEG
jgi:hypothetical protein